MFELRGIEIGYDEGDRYIKLIVRVGYNDVYKVHRELTNIPANKGTLRAMAAGAFGMKASSLIWPHHIEVPAM